MDKKWQVFFLVALSIFMSTLDSSIVNVALPYIMTDMSRTMASIQWVVTVYLLFVSSFLMTFGRLSDIVGRPRIYRLGFGVFTIGSLLCATSPNLGWLVFSRAVQGIGASMLMACSPALIVDVFEPQNRGKALGLVGTSVAAGLTLGPVVGGFLLEYFSWPVIFYINIPVGVYALVCASRIFKNQKTDGSREPMDFLGSLCMVCMVAGLVILLVRLQDWGLFSFQTISCLLISLGAAAGVAINAGKADHPILDPGLFRIRMFVMPLAASLIMFSALFFLVFLMPFYLSLACGFPPSRTGAMMIIPFILLLVVSPLAGTLSDRLGSSMLCSTGMGCLALSLAFSATLTASAGIFEIFWRLALAGLGIGLFISPNSMAAMGAVPMARRGVASGAVATARNLGMVIGVALASGIFSHTFNRLTQGIGLDHYSSELSSFFMTGFKYAMFTGTAIAVVGIGVTIARGKQTIKEIQNG